MVKILKFDEKDCLNFRFGVEPIAAVKELQYEEVEDKRDLYIGRKHTGYFTSGHAILDIPYANLVTKNIDWDRAVTSQFSSKSKMGLVLNNFRITKFNQSGDKTVISFV